MTWYRKQRFCRSDGSCALAKVPIRASVSTTPRTVSSARVRSSARPRGCSTMSRHRSGSTLGAQVGGAGERTGERRLHDRGQPPQPRGEVRPRGQVLFAARHPAERVPGGWARLVLDQQPVVPDRGVGGDPARPQLQVQRQLVHDHVRQQRHQVRVPRQRDVDPVEHPGPGHRAAQALPGLENDGPQTPAGEVRGGDQPVVATAHHDHVGVGGGGHGPESSPGRPRGGIAVGSHRGQDEPAGGARSGGLG